MFDDDTSYLEECARATRRFGLNVQYPDDHSILVVYKEHDIHTVGLIRKLRNIPFYQAFMFEFIPSSRNYLELVQTGMLFTYILRNPQSIRRMEAADVSGHDNFENGFLDELRKRFT